MIAKTPSSGNRSAGFTLLELLAGLTILAVAAGMAYPAMSNARRNLALSALASDIAADLKIARAQARTENRDTLVLLDTTARTYVSSSMSRKKVIPADVAIDFQANASEQTSQSVIGFRFRPDGTASGGSLALQARGQTASIAIDWLTGAITSTTR